MNYDYVVKDLLTFFKNISTSLKERYAYVLIYLNNKMVS